jgi:hypothetical protein
LPNGSDDLDWRSPDGLKPVPSEPSKSTAFRVADGAKFGKKDPFTDPTRSTDELPGTEGEGSETNTLSPAQLATGTWAAGSVVVKSSEKITAAFADPPRFPIERNIAAPNTTIDFMKGALQT